MAQISHLPDDVLTVILRQTLPVPGLLTSRTAVLHRRAYLHFPFTEAAGDEGAWDDAWTSCLTGTAVSSEILEHPPWQRGAAADRMYTAATGRLPAFMVCKRWNRLLLRGHVVQVAMVDSGATPPSAVQVLVLACPSPWKRVNSWPHYCNLQGLTNLKALIFCYVSKDVYEEVRNEGSPASPIPLERLVLPQIPPGVSNLQHLMYVDLQSKVRADRPPADLTWAAFRSVTCLTSLRSLCLPTRLDDNVVCEGAYQVLRALPQRLTHLHARCLQWAWPWRCCTALRSLRAAFADADVTPLSHLAALSSLCLVNAKPEKPLDLTGLECLSQLHRLELYHFALGASATHIAALSALTSLRIDTWVRSQSVVTWQQAKVDDALIDALALLPQPPRLSLTVCSSWRLGKLAKLTALEHLDLARRCILFSPNNDYGPDPEPDDIPDDEAFRNLASLTRLTSLVLNWDLEDDDAAALVHMTRLRHLSLGCSNLKYPPHALQSLTALQELAISDNSSHGPAVFLSALDAPVFPGLTYLKLNLPGSPWPKTATGVIARFSALEELDLSENYLMDVDLKQLRALKLLRALRVTGCYLPHGALRELVHCEALDCVAVDLGCIAATRETERYLVALFISVRWEW